MSPPFPAPLRTPLLALSALGLALALTHTALSQVTPERPTEPPRQQPAEPAEACLAACGSTPCEWPEFHGFSPDSHRLGFSLLKCPGPDSTQKPRRFFHLRSVQGKLGRLGLTPLPIKGVQFFRYFLREGFSITRLAPSDAQPLSWSATLPNGPRLSIELKTEKSMVLEVSGWRGQELLFRSKTDLADIYFGMSVGAFVAPDGRRVFLVVNLNAQYKWDAWTAAFSLSP